MLGATASANGNVSINAGACVNVKGVFSDLNETDMYDGKYFDAIIEDYFDTWSYTISKAWGYENEKSYGPELICEGDFDVIDQYVTFLFRKIRSVQLFQSNLFLLSNLQINQKNKHLYSQ